MFRTDINKVLVIALVIYEFRDKVKIPKAAGLCTFIRFGCFKLINIDFCASFLFKGEPNVGQSCITPIISASMHANKSGHKKECAHLFLSAPFLYCSVILHVPGDFIC